MHCPTDLAFMWQAQTMPKAPWKLYEIEADYRPNNVNKPRYHVCAQSSEAAKTWFARTYAWLKVYKVTLLWDAEVCDG